jgi:hypothetical protein
MRIIDVAAEVFTYSSEVERDAEGHSHPGHSHQATQSMVRIVTDEGVMMSFGTMRRQPVSTRVVTSRLLLRRRSP